MNRTQFNSIEDFKNKSYIENDKCDCGCSLEISPTASIITINNVTLTFDELHLLICSQCGKSYIPFYSSMAIHTAYDELIRAGITEGIFPRLSYRKKFDYCTEIDFVYDHFDYYNIPGLKDDQEHRVEGYLTPVFFDKKALQQFFLDEDYRVHLAAETYGYFRMGDDWEIPFGININDKVVFWLGDLDTIDEKTLEMLKPHNVESDHKLLSSEFFAVQMCCVWVEPNLAYRVYQLRNKLYTVFSEDYGISLDHLSEEAKRQIDDYSRPLVINSKTFPETVSVLHKVLIEGVNLDALRELYKLICQPKDDKWKDLLAIKLYEGLLSQVIASKDQVRDIISPLYLLNDLRICYDHLLSKAKEDTLKQNIVSSLGIESFSQAERIYHELMKKLAALYRYLIVGYSSKSRNLS